MMWSMRAQGAWSDQRGDNLLDGAAPFYDTYECADGRYVAVGPIEPQFYSTMLATLGLDESTLPGTLDRTGWPALREQFGAAFKTRTRDEWAAVFADLDACVTPVVELGEVAGQPHLLARGTFTTVDGVHQAAPAPRFSRTAPGEPRPPRPPGADTDAVLRDWLG